MTFDVTQELKNRFNKMKIDEKMPDNIAIKSVDSDNEGKIELIISMDPETCKNWSGIMINDLKLEDSGYNMNFDYSHEREELVFTYTAPGWIEFSGH